MTTREQVDAAVARLDQASAAAKASHRGVSASLFSEAAMIVRAEQARADEAEAERDEARAREQEMREALAPFARTPMTGKQGGKFVIAHAIYEDMDGGKCSAPREAYWHEEDFRRASRLTGERG